MALLGEYYMNLCNNSAKSNIYAILLHCCLLKLALMLSKSYKRVVLALTTFIVLSCGQSSGDTGSTKGVLADTVATSDFDEAMAIPDFTLSTIADSADFNSRDIPREGIVLLKYFSPDCDHCQEEADTYVSKKDSLQNIKTIWVSGDWAPLSMIKGFAETYGLEALGPIVIGKETTNDLLAFYKLSGIPFAAVYKDDQLIREYRGPLDFKELIEINDGTFVPEPIALTSRDSLGLEDDY